MINNIQDYISSLVGIPYKSHGRDFSGADCWGLAYLYHEKQLPSFDNTYSNANDPVSVSMTIDHNKTSFIKIPMQERQKGDIILFRILGVPVHVGIILDNKDMIHTLSGHNSCIEEYTSNRWTKRIEGIYRWQNC